MTEKVTNELIFEVLKRVQQDVSDIKGDVQDLKLRTTVVEEHLGNIMLSISGLNSRMDRLDERLSRVERRMELTR
jgi:predicted  nucleic acid-binding Zn-ribbon protein